MKDIKFIFGVFLLVLISGCAVTTVNTYQAAGKSSICNGANLGKIAVLPEAAWRPDQKEPAKRELMALEEIKSSFQGIPCGSVSAPGGVKEFSNWSSTPEAELLAKFSSEGIDTLILIRVEELTPRIQFTFSLPFLWAGSNEADFRVRVLSTRSGAVLNDMRVKRLTGGPFNVRPADWSRAELNSALSDAIGNY